MKAREFRGPVYLLLPSPGDFVLLNGILCFDKGTLNIGEYSTMAITTANPVIGRQHSWGWILSADLATKLENFWVQVVFVWAQKD